MNIWDEKNYTEPKKSCLNNNVKEEKDIIKNMLIVSRKKECKNTGWTRKCPICDKVLYHKTNYIRNRQQKIGALCKGCTYPPTIHNLERNCPKCNKVLIYTKPHHRNSAEKKKLICVSCTRRKPIPILVRSCSQCNSKINYKDTSKLNRANRENRVCNTCRKQNFIKQMETKSAERADRKLGPWFIANYNKNACEYFDWLNKWMGWNGQHALYKGEKGVLNYFVDYYEPNQNLVIEWDESYHTRQIEKDRNRQERIKEQLGCKFFRYNELTKLLVEV